MKNIQPIEEQEIQMEEVLVAIRKFVEARTGYIEPSDEYILRDLVKQALQTRDQAWEERIKEQLETILQNIKTEIGWGKIGFTEEKFAKVAVFLEDIERIVSEITPTSNTKEH